jgi:hypothetical protein
MWYAGTHENEEKSPRRNERRNTRSGLREPNDLLVRAESVSDLREGRERRLALARGQVVAAAGTSSTIRGEREGAELVAQGLLAGGREEERRGQGGGKCAHCLGQPVSLLGMSAAYQLQVVGDVQ